MNARRNLQADMASSGERPPIYLTPTRRALLRGVADLEISMDESGTYRWLGNQKVNARLYELESQGWLVFNDVGAPHITGLGRIALRDADKETTHRVMEHMSSE